MKKFIRLPYIIAIFVVLALLMFSSALIELKQSRKELLELMDVNAHAILDAVAEGSSFSIYSNQLLEDEVFERLYDNALLLGMLDESGDLTPSKLQEIVETNHLGQILLLDKQLRPKMFAVNREFLSSPLLPPRSDMEKMLSETDIRDWVLVHGNGDNKVFSIAIPGRDSRAIVVSIEARVLLEFRKKTGIGILISEIANNPNIIYLAVQDTFGIIAAKNISVLSDIKQDSLVYGVYSTGIPASRVVDFGDSSIYEVVHPFELSGRISGVYRMGLSLEALELINRRVIRRMIIISVILLFLGTLLMVLINYRQQFDFINKAFDRIQSHYKNVVINIADGILTIDKNGKIITANPAAGKILEAGKNGLKGENLFELGLHLPASSSKTAFDIEYKRNGKKKYLTLSVADMPEADEKEAVKIIVIQDKTEKTILENRVRQKDKLTAMGKLASGVAHEVRNPLNAISTIVQQFDLDFEPKENADEYHSLAKLVISEVKRINKIITQFVELSRPPELVFQSCDIVTFMNQIEQIANGLIGGKEITFKLRNNVSGEVIWDCEQIKQSLINLIKNSVDAVGDNGTITLNVEDKNNILEVHVKDDGPGIPAELQPRIFDLYFTTKNDGTGLGLGIVHRIISGHGGTITVQSDPGKGTEFILDIPKKAGKNE